MIPRVRVEPMKGDEAEIADALQGMANRVGAVILCAVNGAETTTYPAEEPADG